MNFLRFKALLPAVLALLSMGCATKPQAPAVVAAAPLPLASFNDSLGGGFGGIYVKELSSGKLVLAQNEHKFFVPASNTKIFTSYAALSTLGDSMKSCEYLYKGDTLFIDPWGDPTFMHPLFPNQPLEKLLAGHRGPVAFATGSWKTTMYGKGWSWGDYAYNYMLERNALPVAENMVDLTYYPASNGEQGTLLASPPLVSLSKVVFDPTLPESRLERGAYNNLITVYTNGKDTIHTRTGFASEGFEYLKKSFPEIRWLFVPHMPQGIKSTLYSGPTLPVLEKMMHESDNFLAEQLLLMAAKTRLGVLDEEAMIDTLVALDFKSFPDKVNWVDGSGLSRYNLQTPANYVALLEKMAQKFGLDKLGQIFPHANEGTLKGRMPSLSGGLFAKTGTLTGHVALSGFLHTKSNKWLVFSILVTNHTVSSGQIRRATDRLLTTLYETR